MVVGCCRVPREPSCCSALKRLLLTKSSRLKQQARRARRGREEGGEEGGGREGGGGRGGGFSLDAASTGPVDWESLLQDADRLLSMRTEADERASQQMLQRAPRQHQPPPQSQIQSEPRKREAGASVSTRGSARHGAGSRASATRARPRSATTSPEDARMMRRQRSRASRRAVSAGGQASQLSSQSLGSTISGPAAVASDGSVSSCSPRAPVREVARGLASLGVMGNRTAEDKRRVLKQQQARRARQEREKRLEAEAAKARLAEAKEKYKRLSVEQARAFQQQRDSRSGAIRAHHTAAGVSKSQARAGEEGQSRRARSPAAPVTHAGTQRGSNEGMFGEWASQDSLEDGDLAAATRKQPTRQEEMASKSAGAAPAASRNKTTRGAAGVAVKMVAAVQQQAAKRVQQQHKAQRVTRSFADRRPQERARVSAAKNGDGHESRQRQSDARASSTAKAQEQVSEARGEGADWIDYHSFLQNQKAAENLLDSLISWTRSSSIMQSPPGLLFGTTSAERSQLLTGTGEVKPEGDSEGSLEPPELVLTSERMLDTRPRLQEGIAGDCAEHADGVESEPDRPLALTNGNQTRPGAHDSGDLSRLSSAEGICRKREKQKKQISRAACQCSGSLAALSRLRRGGPSSGRKTEAGGLPSPGPAPGPGALPPHLARALLRSFGSLGATVHPPLIAKPFRLHVLSFIDADCRYLLSFLS